MRNSLLLRHLIFSGVLGCVFVLTPSFASAANLYWVGTDGANTNVASNWKTTDPATCGSGNASAAPGSSDVAIFDADCDSGANINATFSVQGVSMNSGYAGTVTQATGITIAVGSSGWTQAAGTFTGGDAAITFSDSSLVLSGGTFTNTSGGLNIDRHLTITGGTFTNTSKTVTFIDQGSADDSISSCSGTIGGTIVITKDSTGDFKNATGCTIGLGASPTSASSANATLTNSGTMTIASGTWTINGATNSIFTNFGTITHSGNGWDINDTTFASNAGATITYAGTSITMDRSFTQNGTFDLTGITMTFDDNGSSVDDATVACSGTLGGTVVITKDDSGNDFILRSGCSINLGASPTTTTSNNAVITSSGTITIASGTWTIVGGSSNSIFTSFGTITHSGNGWDINDTAFVSNAGATITYGGTSITTERSFTQNGTFNLSGITITLDDTAGNDDTILTCTGTLGGTVVVAKDTNGDFKVGTGCSINLGASPTLTGSANMVFTNSGTMTITSGTWTINGGASVVFTNFGTITHSGNGWDVNDAGFINSAGATITYGGTSITMQNLFTQNGTFDLTGVTMTFDDDSAVDDTTITCTGTLGGTVIVTKDTDGDFIVASGCSINLGANPTTTIDSSATNDFLNNGTVVIPSGTWTVEDVANAGTILVNSGTIIHSGNGWDLETSLVNNAHATITYAGTNITMERSLTQNGTFDLTGKTITFDDNSSGSDDSTIACGVPLNGNVTINKNANGADTVLGSSCTILGSFTRTNGPLTNPASAFILTVQGNFSMSTTDAFGGSNLTLKLSGTGTQTVTQNAGSLSGALVIDKSAGSAHLTTALTTSNSVSTCTVTEGTLDLNGNTLTCGGTLTVEDGGTLRLEGGESVTTPTLNAGSTVWYDDPAGTTALKNYTYSHLIIGSTGSTVFTLPASTLDINKNFTLSGGTLRITNAQAITLSGSWLEDGGTFSAGTGTVTLDGADQSILGSNTFYNLTKTTSVPRTLTFGAGDTQTIAGTLTLHGAASNLLSLRSSQTGTQWNIDPQSTRTLAYLDVQDGDNINGTAMDVDNGTFIDGGNNTNWRFHGAGDSSSDSESSDASVPQGNGGRRGSSEGMQSRIAQAQAILLARFDKKLRDEEKQAETLASAEEKARIQAIQKERSDELAKREAELEEAAERREERIAQRIKDFEQEVLALQKEKEELTKDYAKYRKEATAKAIEEKEARIQERKLEVAAEQEALKNEQEENKKLREQLVAERKAAAEEGTENEDTDTTQTPIETTPEVIAARRGILVAYVENEAVLYSDVKTDEWYAPYVSYLVEEQIATGYADEQGKPTGEFGVQNPVTYAEVLKMALEAAGQTLSGGSPRNKTAQGSWASSYVAEAEKLQLSVFTNDLDVHAAAARGEVVQILMEAMDVTIGTTVRLPYTDVPANHPHALAIDAATYFGLVEGDRDVNGQPTNTFRPDDDINRAEVAKIIALMKEVSD